jgi:ketosteroid isomerase-like protein
MRGLLMAAALGLLAAPVQAQDAARAEVLAVVHGYHAALAAGDSAGAIARLHPDVVVFESGHAETLAEYRAGHLPADMAFAGATRREIGDESVLVRDDIALYTAGSRTTGEFRGRAIDSRGAETMVLIRTPEGWRIRHIHWSSGR